MDELFDGRELVVFDFLNGEVFGAALGLEAGELDLSNLIIRERNTSSSEMEYFCLLS